MLQNSNFQRTGLLLRIRIIKFSLSFLSNLSRRFFFDFLVSFDKKTHPIFDLLKRKHT